ncbi:MAG: hypothetical protein KKC55_13790 [Gammaproteobacteria bacterium]|nr:hypothetical protein [Gammaproteobacteria bacterium]
MKYSSKSVFIVLAFWLVLIIVSSVFAQTIVVRVRGVPQVVDELAKQVIFLLEHEQRQMNWDRTHVNNLAAGSSLVLENDATMLKEDWIAEADSFLLNLQNRIDAINALR